MNAPTTAPNSSPLKTLPVVNAGPLMRVRSTILGDDVLV